MKLKTQKQVNKEVKEKKTKKIVYYQIAYSNGCYDTKTFLSAKEAKEDWKRNVQSRNKQDGYDEYWKNMPVVIQKITTITTEVERLK